MVGVEFQPFLGPFAPRFPLESLQEDKSFPRDLGLKAAKLVREQANIGFPADLIELARLFRVSAIFYQDIKGAKGLIPNLYVQDQNYEVLIDTQEGYEPEQKFTLAHEVGHIALKDSGIGLPPRHDREEFCDAFAEEILLPEDIVRNAINKAGSDKRLYLLHMLFSKEDITESFPPYLLVGRLVRMGVSDIFVVVPLNHRENMSADGGHGAWGWMYGPEIKPPNYNKEKVFIKRLSRLIQKGNERIKEDPIESKKTLRGVFSLGQQDSDDVDCGVYLLGAPIPEFGIAHFARRDLSETDLYSASRFLAQRGF